MSMTIYCVQIAYDSYGPHLEYYETEPDFQGGLGYPIDELEPEYRDVVLMDILKGLYGRDKKITYLYDYNPVTKKIERTVH